LFTTNLFSNSSASFLAVISAPKATSKTCSKPICLRAVTIFVTGTPNCPVIDGAINATSFFV